MSIYNPIILFIIQRKKKEGGRVSIRSLTIGTCESMDQPVDSTIEIECAQKRERERPPLYVHTYTYTHQMYIYIYTYNAHGEKERERELTRV